MGSVGSFDADTVGIDLDVDLDVIGRSVAINNDHGTVAVDHVRCDAGEGHQQNGHQGKLSPSDDGKPVAKAPDEIPSRRHDPGLEERPAACGSTGHIRRGRASARRRCGTGAAQGSCGFAA